VWFHRLVMGCSLGVFLGLSGAVAHAQAPEFYRPAPSSQVPLLIQQPAPPEEKAEVPEPPALPAPRPAPAADRKDTPSLRDELDTVKADLKKVHDEFKKEIEASKATRYPNVKFQGRIHFDQLVFPTSSRGIGFFENPTTGNDPENAVYFRRLRLTFRGDVTPMFGYKLDIEFARPDEVLFRDAYLHVKELAVLQNIYIGNTKRPISLDQLNSSNDNVFLERSLLGDVEDSDARRPGFLVWGYNEAETLNWQIGTFLLADIDAVGRYNGDPLQPSFNTRLVWIPWYDECSGGRGYLHLGLANQASWPDPDPNAGDSQNTEARFRTRPELRTLSRWIDTGTIAGADFYDTIGLEGILNVGALSIVAEWAPFFVQRQNVESLFFHGGYIYAAYYLTGEHQPYDRKRGTLERVQPFENFFLVERCCGRAGGGWGAWQIAARLSYADLTDNDVRGGVERNVTLGLNWWFNHNARWGINYVWGHIADRRPAGGFTSGDFSGIQSRFQVNW
jgi:phosphate-selective porin OprO/OprP